MTFLGGKSNILKGDIDLLVTSLQEAKVYFSKKKFIYTSYLGKESGFFMKKLTTRGLVNFHIQNKIFYLAENQLIVVEGFETLVLEDTQKYRYMRYMMKMVFEKKSKAYYVSAIEEQYQTTINQIDLVNEVEKFIRLHGLHLEKKTLWFAKLKQKLQRAIYLFYPRFIAITGVDGSGKSTTLHSLKEKMGHNATITYMGKKCWQTTLAKKFLIRKRLPSILNILILYIEFLYRFFKGFRNSKVVLFDRYPNEMYLTQTGIRRVIYYLLFCVFFPNPSKIFYLYCPEETSLKRKDDIDDPEEFKRRKQAFDQHYQKAVGINTENKSTQEVLKVIIKNLPEKSMYLL